MIASTAAFWALVLPAVTALLVVRSHHGHDAVQATVAWCVLYATAVIVPVQFFAAVQILGITSSFTIAQSTALQLAALIAAIGLAYKKGHLATLKFPVFRHGPVFIRVSVAALGGCYLLFAVSRVAFYPESWDGVAYHLPTALAWLQDGSMAVSTATNWRAALPGNAEIFAMLALGTGWQQLAELWNVLSTVALLGGCYLLARAVTRDTTSAWASVIVVASLPIVIFQSFAAYVDLFGTAFLVAGFGIFISVVADDARELTLSWAVLVGLACGLAIGTKPTLWPLAAIFLIGATAGILVRTDRFPRRSVVVLVLFACVLVPALFWFGRSLVGTGNPLYPFSVHVFGISVFEGVRAWDITAVDYDLAFVRSRLAWLIYPWTENYLGGYAYGAGVGVGAVFATFVPLGVLFALAQCVKRRSPRAVILMGLCLYLAIGVVVWWFFLKRTPRFGIALIVLGAVLAAPLIEQLANAHPRAFGALFLSAVMTTAVIASLPPAVLLLSRFRDGWPDRHEIYEIPRLVDNLPEGSVVLNYNHWRAHHNNFALAGRSLTNRVVSDWEVPDRMTQSFLDEKAIDYVFEKEPFIAYEDSTVLAGGGYLILGESQVSQAGWRVWKREEGGGTRQE